MGNSVEGASIRTLDAEALRAKYEAERAKRIRSDGNDQYIEVTGKFAHYLDDPYTPVIDRESLVRDVDVVFVGGGFAGLLMGARLVEAGIDDFLIVEKGGDFGGTWYWNRYPGAQCDTAAMIYLPLLEETGHMPSEKYTHAPEILEHSQRIGRHFGLYDHAMFSTEVTSVEWDDAAHRWVVLTNRGDVLRARFVSMGTGPLHRPKLPGIPGIESFAGHSFHTSRWDYDHTGGDPSGTPLTGLTDKRVGIIGTGATAVQCIPHLAKAAKELFVFQRTPSSVDTRNNHEIDPSWFAELPSGWQHEWMMNFTTLQTGGFADVDLVKDGWTDIAQRIRDRIVAELQVEFTPDVMRRAYEASDDEKMEEIRARIDALVADPEVADGLKPWYRQLCKRPCFHDEYLQAFNEPGVRLVDTDGRGVTSIDADGVWVGEEHFPLDCLIYASGFEVGTSYARRSGFETVGRDGLTLSDAWAEGMVSMHGIHVHGFPNMFIVGMSQGANLISNIPHNLVEAASTVAAVIAHALEVGSDHVEVTAEAQDAWIAKLLTAGPRIIGTEDCTPGYYNNEGGPLGRRERLNAAGYPEGPIPYFNYITDWRTNGEFKGLTFG